MPGERALAMRDEQLAQGVALYPTIMPALVPWGDRLGVKSPVAQI
jgi:L-lactate dehydrogenase